MGNISVSALRAGPIYRGSPSGLILTDRTGPVTNARLGTTRTYRQIRRLPAMSCRSAPEVHSQEADINFIGYRPLSGGRGTPSGNARDGGALQRFMLAVTAYRRPEVVEKY